ncbi:hypothetical protein Tco_0940041 [Tanacetum coccineum]|uniref:Retrotransposon gag domain-containing protein n=1 Tax=Tanacetum coccineum TaxID=301880 RepID=A0ABQ5DLU5_9ASTR
MESVFNISGCAIENQVKFATCTLLGAALTWWNGQIRTLGPDAYSMTWEVLREDDGNSNKQKEVDDSSRNNHGHQQQPFKRQNVAKVYNMGTGEKKPYDGQWDKSHGKWLFECGDPRTFQERSFPVKELRRGNGSAHGWVYAVGNAEKEGMHPGNQNPMSSRSTMQKECQDLFGTKYPPRKGRTSREVEKQLKEYLIVEDVLMCFLRRAGSSFSSTNGITDRLNSRKQRP